MSKNQVLFFIGLFFGFCSLNAQIKWKTLTGNIYQKNIWWCIQIIPPIPFIGSKQKLVATFNHHKIIFQGKHTKQRRLFAYFLNPSPISKLKIEIFNKKLQCIYQSQKTLNLRALEESRKLIGIYQIKEIPQSIYRKNFRIQVLPFLPNQWESLKNYSLLFLKSSVFEDKTLSSILKSWIYHGGKLVVMGDQEVSLDYGKLGLSQNCNFHLLGKGWWIQIPSNIVFKKIWTEVSPRLEKEENFIFYEDEFLDLFDANLSTNWDFKIRYLLWIIFTMSIIAYFFVHTFSKSTRFLIICVFIIASFNFIIIWQTVFSYQKLYYEELTFTEILEPNIALKNKYIYFRALCPGKYSCKFSMLPKPIDPIGYPLYMYKEPSGWRVEVKLKKGEFRIWQTFQSNQISGHIITRKVNDKIFISNQTREILNPILYIGEEKIENIACLMPGASKKFPFSAKKSIYQLPLTWQKDEKLIHWIWNNFPRGILLCKIKGDIPKNKYAKFYSRTFIWSKLP